MLFSYVFFDLFHLAWAPLSIHKKTDLVTTLNEPSTILSAIIHGQMSTCENLFMQGLLHLLCFMFVHGFSPSSNQQQIIWKPSRSNRSSPGHVQFFINRKSNVSLFSSHRQSSSFMNITILATSKVSSINKTLKITHILLILRPTLTEIAFCRPGKFFFIAKSSLI